MVGLLLVSSLIPAGPAAAHVFTKLDGNDSPGKLDLRSAAVSHTSTSVVHRISTYNAWTPQSLGNDSFFVIQIDKNNDRNYERCAFIFYTNRLRGSLSNCAARFIRFLPVAKLSGTAARVTIPKSETGGVYWWGAASLWDGPRPCARGCVDFTPNRFPDILHDLKPPAVTTTTAPLRVWEVSTTSAFVFPFSVSDANSGIRSWTIQRRDVGSTTWEPVLTGNNGGAQTPVINGTEGASYYRVIATDRQGNKKIGAQRPVYVPVDDGDLDPSAFSTVPNPVSDLDAFEEGYSEMAEGDVFTYATGPGCEFALIGPRTGVWAVEVTRNGVALPGITSDGTGGQREFLFGWGECNATLEFTVSSGTGFGVDAVYVD